MARETVLARLADSPEVKAVRAEVEQQVREATLTPALGAQRIIETFDNR